MQVEIKLFQLKCKTVWRCWQQA